MKFKIPFLILFLFISHFSFSQKDTVTVPDLQFFNERNKQYFDRLQRIFATIGSKEKTTSVKNMYKQQALRFFLGEGELYENDQYAAQVRILRISDSLEIKMNMPLKMYLDKLMRRNQQIKCEIIPFTILKMTNIHKVENHFEAEASIFIEYFENKNQKYEKDIKLFFMPENVYENGELKTDWTMKFKNIIVLERYQN